MAIFSNTAINFAVVYVVHQIMSFHACLSMSQVIVLLYWILAQLWQSSDKQVYDVNSSALGCSVNDLRNLVHVFVKMISIDERWELNAQDVQKKCIYFYCNMVLIQCKSQLFWLIKL